MRRIGTKSEVRRVVLWSEYAGQRDDWNPERSGFGGREHLYVGHSSVFFSVMAPSESGPDRAGWNPHPT